MGWYTHTLVFVDREACQCEEKHPRETEVSTAFCVHRLQQLCTFLLDVCMSVWVLKVQMAESVVKCPEPIVFWDEYTPANYITIWGWGERKAIVASTNDCDGSRYRCF
jgi:hypothetical protein